MQAKPFWKLVSGALRLYVSRFKVSVPYSLLYMFLPMALVFYTYGTVLSTLPSIFENVQSVEFYVPFSPSFNFNSSNIPAYLASAMAYTLLPIHLARLYHIHASAWHGRNLGLKQAFFEVKPLRARAMVLNLIQSIFLLGFTAILPFVAVICMFLSMPSIMMMTIALHEAPYIPFILMLCFLALVIIVPMLAASLVLRFSMLVGVSEDIWYFPAIGRAWQLAKKRPLALLGGYGLALLVAIIPAGGFVAGAFLCDASYYLWIAVPLLSLLTCLLAPLESAFITVLYYDLRVVREGYRPPLEDETGAVVRPLIAGGDGVSKEGEA